MPKEKDPTSPKPDRFEELLEVSPQAPDHVMASLIKLGINARVIPAAEITVEPLIIEDDQNIPGTLNSEEVIDAFFEKYPDARDILDRLHALPPEEYHTVDRELSRAENILTVYPYDIRKKFPHELDKPDTGDFMPFDYARMLDLTLQEAYNALKEIESTGIIEERNYSIRRRILIGSLQINADNPRTAMEEIILSNFLYGLNRYILCTQHISILPGGHHLLHGDDFERICELITATFQNSDPKEGQLLIRKLEKDFQDKEATFLILTNVHGNLIGVCKIKNSKDSNDCHVSTLYISEEEQGQDYGILFGSIIQIIALARKKRINFTTSLTTITDYYTQKHSSVGIAITREGDKIYEGEESILFRKLEPEERAELKTATTRTVSNRDEQIETCEAMFQEKRLLLETQFTRQKNSKKDYPCKLSFSQPLP